LLSFTAESFICQFAIQNSKIKKYRTVVLYGCETLSLALRVYGNRVLKRIFGDRRDEVTGEWRKLHNEELNDLYCSPNIDWVIKSTTIRWAGHVARMGRGEAYTGFWWGNLWERDYLGVPGLDGKIIIFIFKK
jgi:hypothetical protein